MLQIAPRGSAFRDDWLKLRHALINVVRSCAVTPNRHEAQGKGCGELALATRAEIKG